MRDKEPPIRVQAVVALSKLSGSEDPSELDEGEPTIIEVLLDTLAYDTVAYVSPLNSSCFQLTHAR